LQHGGEYDEHVSHDGNHSDFVGFSCLSQGVIFSSEGGIYTHGSEDRWVNGTISIVEVLGN
jgi:hypothetical protein